MIKIYTDSCSDIPRVEERSVEVLPLTYHFEDTPKIIYGENRFLTMREYFDEIKNSRFPKTAAVNIGNMISRFREEAKNGNEVIYIAMSSGLSSCYSNGVIARESVLEDFPDANIAVIDARTGCLGEGLLVIKAEEMRDEGKGFDEITSYLENNKLLYNIEFFVSDLSFLKRGGRISSTTAIAVKALGIKPLIYVDDNGKSQMAGKARGEKNCDNLLIDRLDNTIDTSYDTIGIVHSDFPEGAERLENRLRASGYDQRLITGEIGPAIGAHIGPNAYGLVYKKKRR